MGNTEGHHLPPVRKDERKVLDLGRRVNLQQYQKHKNGDYSERCFTELPWNIQDSVSLYESMNVSFNALSELPAELPLRLPHLSFLDLSYNRLQVLPDSFGLLFHLRELYLQHNHLSSLPESFVHLIKLEKVDVSHNSLSQLPADIGMMECLSRLNVVHNQLNVLPLSLGSPSSHIQLLLVQQNQLEIPPQAVCDEGSTSTLEYLRKLYLNTLETLPPRPTVHLNVFPRCCGNKSDSATNNPHLAQIQYIQEQTNTTHTTNRVKAPLLPPFDATTLSPFQLRDRIIGLIYGAAIGDAIGVSCRWMSAEECAFHYGHDEDFVYDRRVQDEHRVLWKQGSWTSNFEQFMLVLESLVNWAGVVDELEFARRLHVWANFGCSELGDGPGVLTSETVSKVVAHPDFCTDPHKASKDAIIRNTVTENGIGRSHSVQITSELSNSKSSSSHPSENELEHLVYSPLGSVFGEDNGALVRTAILGVPNFHQLGEVESNAVRICRTTHSDSKCVASCVFISFLISFLLQGKLIDIEHPEQEVHEEHLKTAFERASSYLSNEPEKQEFLALRNIRSLESFNARQTSQMSHTYMPVRTAIAGLYWKEDYRSFVIAVAKHGGDSSSNACVAGAVLGCFWGFEKLPRVWVNDLCKRQVHWLNNRINHLLDIMGSP